MTAGPALWTAWGAAALAGLVVLRALLWPHVLRAADLDETAEGGRWLRGWLRVTAAYFALFAAGAAPVLVGTAMGSAPPSAPADPVFAALAPLRASWPAPVLVLSVGWPVTALRITQGRPVAPFLALLLGAVIALHLAASARIAPRLEATGPLLLAALGVTAAYVHVSIMLVVSRVIPTWRRWANARRSVSARRDDDGQD